MPEYFGKHSHFEMSDPLQVLLKLHNMSQFSIWNSSKTEFTKLKSIGMPSHLTGLKEIPMQSFLRESRTYKTVNFDDTKTETNWAFVMMIIVVSILVVIVVVWFIGGKANSTLIR